MIYEDDRTPDEMETHRFLVVMTDSFMSGWGGAKCGTSVAAWACKDQADWDEVERWVRRRGDAKRVRCVYESKLNRRRYRPKNAAHFHVYVVDEGHPALGRRRAA